MLYLLRHGKTDWNVLHKLQGRTETHLNEEGRRTAAEAGIRYRDLDFDICFCSTLQRARETAQLFLAGRNTEIVYDDRLMEMGFGRYEGTANVFQKPDCPISQIFRDPERFMGADDAETFESLFERTGSLLREEVEPRLAMGQNVLLIGHGAVNSCIYCQRKGLPLARLWETGMENCRLMEV